MTPTLAGSLGTHAAAESPRARVLRPEATFSRSDVALVIVFFVAHVGLAVVMRAVPTIATIHAVVTLVVGVVFAATTRHVRRIGIVAGYMVGCEVLWRMTKASVFWEFGKYSVAAVLLVGLLRIKWKRNHVPALLYFALLLPSVALTFSALDLDTARQEVSFNLSGPFALTLAVLFFSNTRQTSNQTIATFFALVAPIVGIGALSFISTASETNLSFLNEANATTSGGFGPNQVSAMLGLGVMLLLLIVIQRRLSLGIKVLLFALAVALAAQSALTFARGGLVLALAGMAGALFVMMRGNRRARITIVVITILGVGVGKYVVEPALEEFTNGAIDARYSSTKSSGRDLFIRSELTIFGENPVLGVGPGVGMHIREERGMFAGASHTEYSRMLAEHGIFGFFSLLVLIGLGIRAVRDTRDPSVRALASAMVIWAALFFLVYGTRVAAPALIFGLAFVRPPQTSARAVGARR